MNARDITWLLAGAVVGSILGMFTMALMVVARDADDRSGGVAGAPEGQGDQAQSKTE